MGDVKHYVPSFGAGVSSLMANARAGDTVDQHAKLIGRDSLPHQLELVVIPAEGHDLQFVGAVLVHFFYVRQIPLSRVVGIGYRFIHELSRSEHQAAAVTADETIVLHWE